MGMSRLRREAIEGGMQFGYVEVGPIDEMGNGGNAILQLNRIALNRSTPAARFL